jgi:hypothetical protein
MSSRLLRVQLGDLTQNRNRERISLSPRQCGLQPGEYPYYGPEGIIAQIAGYAYEGEYVLAAAPPRDGPWAFTARGRFSANTHVQVLSCGPEAEAAFLCRVLNALDPAPRAANLKELEALELILPAVEVQRLILKALADIEAKIDLLHDQNRVLHGMIHALFDLIFIFGSGTPRPLGDFAGYRPAPPAPKTAGPIAEEAVEPLNEVPLGDLLLYPREDMHPLFITALIKNPEFLMYAEQCGEGGLGKRRLNGERLTAFELSGPKDDGGRRNRAGKRTDARGEFNRFAQAVEKKLAHNQGELRVLQELRRTLILP